ncbi:iron-containing alcohol dehydrogenase [Allosphingosinicella flava]|uniref:Alcohol dehydrogenase 2 n=1 Tax=Allosphingosinicella flava TaxID=2771430 RepID=A0A7T2GKE3_9SPHN|nr:iron-containing alcohol dehydrogenase [Sphingosinicella flava]QPQ55412.1 iron-containing alcohol dehydrogenase [Sphingosinicella flava]
MKAFDFHYGPRLIAGAGATERIGALLPQGRCLFVTDAQVLNLGLADAALASLAAQGMEAVIFDAVEADPSLGTLEAAVALGQEMGCTSVVGLGGGSPMDVAKLAAYLLATGEDLDTLWGVGRALGKRLPLILVPTTAGTGSEATPVTIITVGDNEKRGVSSAALIADHAILDAQLTLGLPRHVTAATGIDAMVHAIEAFTSARLKNPLSDLLAKDALRLLSANLLIACDDPANMEARSAMLVGAHLAGVAFANAPVAAVHALAYPLGGHFHVPHGLSNALMLPHVLRHNMAHALPLYAELGCLLVPDVRGEGMQAQASALIERMGALSAASGLPQRLSEVGVGADHLDMLAREAMKQERLLINNPCPVGEADARRLYEAAL